MERTGNIVAALLVRGVGLILSGTLAGCLPVLISGYEPSGVGEPISWARAGFHTCIAGVNEVLRTETKAGVVMFTNASRRDKQIGLLIRLVIPPGVTVRLLSPDFIAESSGWEGVRTLTVRSVINGWTPLDGLHGAPGNAGIFDLYSSEKTGLPEVATFRLKFPALAINGDAYQPSEVVFRSISEWGVGAPCT